MLSSELSEPLLPVISPKCLSAAGIAKLSGEWVNAGFTSVLDNPEDGVIKKVYNEWYYFENDHLELWYQTIRKVME